MNTWINYFIEANIGLCLFLLLYFVFLKEETDFKRTRVLLLAGMVASLLFPLLHFQSGPSSLPTITALLPSYLLPEVTVGGDGLASSPGVSEINGRTLVAWIYFTGLALLSIVFMVRIIRLIHLIRSSVTYTYRQFIVAESEKSTLTFSFFHFIFIGQSTSLSKQEKQQVLDHESIHATQWHSADILLLNVMSILFWINPLMLVYKKIFIQLHEFEADARTVENHEVDEYCGLLARAALQSADFPIANHFNQSLTLKRIAMMQTIKTKTKSWKIALIASAFPVFFTLVACQEQLAEDLKRVEQSSAVSLDIPADIQQKLNELKKSGKDYAVIETTTDEGKKTVDKIDASQISTLSIIKDRPDGRTFIIIERNAQNINLALSSSTDKVYTVVEHHPEYVGGFDKMKEFISSNLRYPDIARQKGIQGSVFASFIVDETGAISDIQLVKGISEECDAEAARVIKLMPKWTPGTQDGKNVKVRFVLPIKFALG